MGRLNSWTQLLLFVLQPHMLLKHQHNKARSYLPHGYSPPYLFFFSSRLSLLDININHRTFINQHQYHFAHRYKAHPTAWPRMTFLMNELLTNVSENRTITLYSSSLCWLADSLHTLRVWNQPIQALSRVTYLSLCTAYCIPPVRATQIQQHQPKMACFNKIVLAVLSLG